MWLALIINCGDGSRICILGIGMNKMLSSYHPREHSLSQQIENKKVVLGIQKNLSPAVQNHLMQCSRQLPERKTIDMTQNSAAVLTDSIFLSVQKQNCQQH